MYRIQTILISAILCLTGASISLAQFSYQSSSVSPVPQPQRFSTLIGIFGGISYNMSNGEFPGACDCPMKGGNGVKPSAGVVLEYWFAPQFSVTGGLAYDDLSTRYEVKGTNVVYNETGQPITLEVENVSEVKVAYFTQRISAKWTPWFTNFYLMGGLMSGIVLSDNYKESQRILTNGYVYPTSKTNELIFFDGPFKDWKKMNDPFFALQAGIGYDIPVSRTIFVSPEVTYMFPLTSTIKEVSGWKTSQISGKALVKFRI